MSFSVSWRLRRHRAAFRCNTATVRRTILIVLGWVITAAALYLLLVGLELYWNLYTWQPRPDLLGSGLLLGAVLAVAAAWFFARASRDRISRGVSLVICCALLALAVYLLPPEPFTEGLFSRELPSPLWYRASRSLLLAAPAAFWILTLRTSRANFAQTGTASSRSTS
jgi:hypothetical protein